MNIETMKQVIEKLKVAMTDARQDESHFESWMILNEAICNSIDDLRAAIEQAEKQEPHGYLVHRNWKEPRFVGVDDLEGVPNLPFRNPEYTPLYTAPPQRSWQGLTDEEVWGIYCEATEQSEQGWLWNARAIEAKLKDKNT